MKTAIALTAVLLLSFAPATAQPPGDVYLSSVTGLGGTGILIESGSTTTVDFVFSFRNNDAVKAKRMVNGFEFYGSDSSVTWVLNYSLDPSFPMGNWDYFFSPWWHLGGTDTVGFASTVIVGPGLPAGFDGPVLNFTVALSDTASVGGTFCIDSAWYPPDGIWMWAFGSHSIPPTWDGPHCYDIVGSCCVGQRGNVDGDPDDLLDISDLVYLTDYMFTGGPVPPCWDEADIDGDGGSVIDISDLVYMLEFMFNGGPPPPDCP